ncbi:MAG: AAA family ATPase [Albidovulum sp.]|uniref:AAA family ATPase n=1 Tax=Albidovulum sp. TaxID=1872424 RepID=UPI003C9D02E6
MFETILTYLAQGAGSDIFAGGTALGLLGASLALGRGLLASGWQALLRRVMVTVTLDNRTAAYRGFYGWLTMTGVLAHARRVRITDVHSVAGEVYGPAPGLHWFWREGRLCLFLRERKDSAGRDGPAYARPVESVSLTLIFGRVATIRRWIAEGQAHLAAQERIGPEIHVFQDSYWEELGQVTARKVETVLCDDDRIDRLVADMRRFLGARGWYATRGIPWRRGYLLHGPPGTGKSSVIRALASELGLDIAILDIGRAGLGDEALRQAMVTAPKGAILAIEDIDAAFRQRKKGEAVSGVTFSGLLNAIDGVAAQEGRALVMTTNHPDRLDPALIRPGRADMHVELGLIGAGTAARLFARFFPDRPDLVPGFEAALGAARFTPAALQGWLLAHAEDAESAASAEGLIPKPVKTTMAAE